jgi:methylenetetrahydrofolate reductase (NADPH)
MKIGDILKQRKNTLSFEVFPPKAGTDVEPIRSAVREIAKLKPDFMSVTYGAGGGNSKNTLEIAKEVQSGGVTALAHLTCIGATHDTIKERLDAFKAAGIDNVLALRGDRPKDMQGDFKGDFTYASELVAEIQKHGGFSVGAACYPEGHTECASRAQDMENLKIKVESGCSFLTTQMFFDNSALYSFLYRLSEKNIEVPVVAGVMPVTNGKQIARICELSGTSLPQRFRMIADKYGDNPAAMKQAGIAYATEQIIDLFANGIHAVHVYTMNKPDVAKAIMDNVSEIIK